MESSAAELRSLENAHDSCCTLHILPILYMNLIRTFGQHSLTLNLGLRRSFPWMFIVADLQKPILGANFLRHYGLMVDMHKYTLVDTNTHN